MELFFAHFLRGTVSAIANVVLFISLLQPKYSRKVTNLVMFVILTLNLSTAVFCYISGNLTLLAKIDVVLFALLCFAASSLFPRQLHAVAVLLHHGNKRKLYRDDTQLYLFKVFTPPPICKHPIAHDSFYGGYSAVSQGAAVSLPSGGGALDGIFLCGGQCFFCLFMVYAQRR